MLLYKMELYKMFHRRSVWVAGIVMFLLLGFYFLALMDEERSTVEGVTRFGYAAIQQDRKITKEFAGILTDETLQQIVEKYGFPSQVRSDYGGWWDKNYLTEYVTDYFSDGYMRGWDIGMYQVPKHLISIKESKIEEEIKENDFYFAYSKGWTKYIEFMQFASSLLLIWLVVVLSPLFAQERDEGTHALLFTTENGSTKDVHAKILAAFSMTFMSFFAVALIALIGIWVIYGLDGAQELWTLTNHSAWIRYFTKAQFSFWYMLRCGIAAFMTCSFCILASAESKSNSEALLIVGGMLLVPFVLLFIFARVWFAFIAVIGYSQPIFFIMVDLLEDMQIPCGIFLCTGAILGVACMLAGRREWIKSGLE